MSVPVIAPVAAPPGFQRALSIFHRAARYVPAYADFLGGHGIDATRIRTPEQFETIPPVTKAGYLRRYPVESLMWHGEAAGAGTWSCSSGSTGSPSYWPRDLIALDESTELYARIFRDSFDAARCSTLLVIGFAMGNWIGGTYSYGAGLALRRRGLRVSVIAPGIEPETILGDIERLGERYDQVVLAGYPPFVKDVLDQAPETVLRNDIRLLLAGEAITETWRDRVLDRLGKPGRPTDICLIYGTADAGVMGHETPTTIAIRRAAAAVEPLGRELFGGQPVQPTFVEYDAEHRYTEVDSAGCFLFTCDNAIPLVRYRINDHGRALSADTVAEVLGAYRPEVPVRISGPSCGFLALDGRTDIAASFYGLKIYPENIRAALEEPDTAALVSGKFVLSVGAGERLAQALTLRIELRAGASAPEDFRTRLRARVIAALDRTNSEFRRLHQTLGTDAEPTLTLHAFGAPGFGGGVKHQWTETLS